MSHLLLHILTACTIQPATFGTVHVCVLKWDMPDLIKGGSPALAALVTTSLCSDHYRNKIGYTVLHVVHLNYTLDNRYHPGYQGKST